MLLGQLDGAVEQRPRVGARPGHRGGAQQSPEDGKSLFALHRDLDVELDELPRVRPRAVDNPEARPGQAEAPSLALTDAEAHGISPRRRRGLTPERDEQRRPGHSILFEHGAESLRRGIGRDDVIAECGEKGFAKPVEDAAQGEGWPELRPQRPVPGAQATACGLASRFVEQSPQRDGDDMREDVV